MEEEREEEVALEGDEMTKNLETRVSILETETDHLKEALRELKERSDDTYDLIYAVKENQDKQNGILPKIWDKMENMDTYIVKQEKTNIKVKIMWGIIGVLGTGILSFVIYQLKDLVSP